jgi:hypothetical protein
MDCRGNGAVHRGAGDVEQQPPDRTHRIMDGSADAEYEALDGERVDDVFRITPPAPEDR